MKQLIVFVSLIATIIGLSSAQGITFGLVTDLHFASGKATSGTRVYSASPLKLQQVVDTFELHSLPFMAMLGDLLDGFTATDSVKTLRDIDSINYRTNTFSGEKYVMFGNHDQTSLTKAQFLGKVSSKINQKYYSFDKGQFHFVVLDGNYKRDSTDFSLNNYTWDSAWVPAKEKQWLINDLSASAGKPVIVFLHYLLDSTNIAEDLRNAAEIRTIFENAGNVVAMFCGHRHTGGYWQSKDIHYINLQGLVEQTLPANNFAEATITPAGDSLIIKGYFNQPSYKLKLKTIAPGAPILTAPVFGAIVTTAIPTLTWGTVAKATTYRVQVSTISAFTSTVINDSTSTAGTKTIASGLNDGIYYWRVNAKNTGGTSAWSAVSDFVVSGVGITFATPHYESAVIGHNGTLEVYTANGSRVMEIAYGASATKTQLLNTASKTLAKGYYTYRFRCVDANVEIVGKLLK